MCLVLCIGILCGSAFDHDSVDLHSAINGDHQTLAAVDLAGFHQIGAVGIDLDDDIGLSLIHI